MSQKQTPRDFLKLIIGRPVSVKLNSGADYRGVLISLDGYMNVVLEQTEEYVDGQLKNKYGDAFIRGNNGKLVIFHQYSFHSFLHQRTETRRIKVILCEIILFVNKHIYISTHCVLNNDYGYEFAFDDLNSFIFYVY